MQRILLAALLLTDILPVIAQTNLAGKYQYITLTGEKSPVRNTLVLYCDHSFLAEDSAEYSLAGETWKIRKHRQLLIDVRYVINDGKQMPKKTKFTLLIVSNELHEEIMNRRQYKRQNKKFDKRVLSCLPGS